MKAYLLKKTTLILIWIVICFSVCKEFRDPRLHEDGINFFKIILFYLIELEE